jgi:hypothetical protein
MTAITQIGGVVFLISMFTFSFIDKRFNVRWKRAVAKTLSFSTLYLLFVFLIVPLAAEPLGRVPLPMLEDNNVKPGNIWTCLLNRHYVRADLREITFKAATTLNEKYPGAIINYLDANFPFIDGFSLFPHLSHNDGKKLDLSFQYNDSVTGLISSDIPSIIGYGVCEEPQVGEEDKPSYCEEKGYWQYSLLRTLVSQINKDKFIFDNKRTRVLINSFVGDRKIEKVFVEPHIKSRLKLTSPKIRFHGCQAVRHDDHIHVQLY